MALRSPRSLRSLTAWAALVAATLLMVSRHRAEAAPGDRLHAEVDPLPFSRGGYGGQLGYRPTALSGFRIALASFSLRVPDFATQVGSGNEGFHARVRPSVALYALYYPRNARDGWAFGASLRYLRLRYTHDDEAGERGQWSELSPELIAGYQWHPFESGFYLQPWLGLSTTLLRRGDPRVGQHPYDTPPIQPFFTVNLGWELQL